MSRYQEIEAKLNAAREAREGRVAAAAGVVEVFLGSVKERLGEAGKLFMARFDEDGFDPLDPEPDPPRTLAGLERGGIVESLCFQEEGEWSAVLVWPIEIPGAIRFAFVPMTFAVQPSGEVAFALGQDGEVVGGEAAAGDEGAFGPWVDALVDRLEETVCEEASRLTSEYDLPV